MVAEANIGADDSDAAALQGRHAVQPIADQKTLSASPWPYQIAAAEVSAGLWVLAIKLLSKPNEEVQVLSVPSWV